MGRTQQPANAGAASRLRLKRMMYRKTENLENEISAFRSQRAVKSDVLVVNAPPAKAGGFGLRLKAGLIGRSADYTTVKSSSGSGGR